MKHYTAEVETTKRGTPTPNEIDAMMDALAEYAPALTMSPRGRRGVRVTFPADTVAQAASTVLAVVPPVLGGDVVRLELMTEEEADLRAGTVDVPELIGAPEAAAILGVTPQRVRQMIDEGKLPAHRVGARSFALTRTDVDRLLEKN